MLGTKFFYHIIPISDGSQSGVPGICLIYQGLGELPQAQFLVLCMETHGVNELAYMFHNTSLFSIVWAELR